MEILIGVLGIVVIMGLVILLLVIHFTKDESVDEPVVEAETAETIDPVHEELMREAMNSESGEVYAEMSARSRRLPKNGTGSKVTNIETMSGNIKM